MTDKYTTCIRISSADGRNTVESFLNDVRKRADKGKVEFGVSIDIERIEDPDEIDGEEPTPSSSD